MKRLNSFNQIKRFQNATTQTNSSCLALSIRIIAKKNHNTQREMYLLHRLADYLSFSPTTQSNVHSITEHQSDKDKLLFSILDGLIEQIYAKLTEPCLALPAKGRKS